MWARTGLQDIISLYSRNDCFLGEGWVRYCDWTRCMYAHSLSCIRLFATPWAVAYQAPLPVEFSRQEYLNGLSLPTPGDLPDPGMELASLASPALAGGFFTIPSPGKPKFS